MKKGFWFLGLMLMSFLVLSCEEDDVCVGEGTPFLTVVFRNNLGTENFKDSITIWGANNADFSDETLVLPKTFTDSIKLPLGGLEHQVTYFRIQRRSNVQSDILQVNYHPKSEYVSKACGFRIVYENLNFQSTNYFIENITPGSTNNLDNETFTNLYISLSF